MGRHVARAQVKNLSTQAALVAVYCTDHGGLRDVPTDVIFNYISENFPARSYPRRVVLAKLKQLRRKGYLEAGGFVGKIYDPTKWCLTMAGQRECRLAYHIDPRMAKLILKAKNDPRQKGY